MNAPWFDPMLAWIPGTLLGVTAGIYGALCGVLLPKGKGVGVLRAGFWILFAASVVLLALGITAWLGGQPYGVWYGLGLAGMIGVVVLGSNGIVIFRMIRQVEERRIQAQDMP